MTFLNKDQFPYWFENTSDQHWKVFDVSLNTKDQIGSIIEESGRFVVSSLLNYDSGKIDQWFRQFKSRPEYYVYDFERIYSSGIDSNIDMYKNLMTGCIFLRKSSEKPENLMSKVDNMFKWIDSTDFYSAPASTRFHGCQPCGLLDHTLKVAYMVCKLLRTDIWQGKVKLEDAIFVALVHDWCKIDLYESYVRNVKNDKTGEWEKQLSYKVKDTPMSCLGHGVSSMFLAQRFFKLSIDEAAAIRWHMGEYNVADNEMNDLHQANETYPMVQLLQFADRLSIVKYL